MVGFVEYPESGFWIFPNDKKCWIIAKPNKKETVEEVFKEANINVTVQGKKHQDAVVGSRGNQEKYVSGKLSWEGVRVGR